MMASITCGNCGNTHDSVDGVKLCYSGVGSHLDAYANNPVAQMVLSKDTRTKTGPRFAPSEPMFEDEPDEQSNPKVVYVPATEPGASTRNKNDQTAPGFYNVDGFIFKVTPARSSDRTFAHELTFADDKAPEWVYKGLAKKYVPMYANKLTLEDAKKYGRTHGHCLICGRLLTAEQSVAEGIGPICAGKL